MRRLLNERLFDGIWGDLLQEYYEDSSLQKGRRPVLRLVRSASGYIRFPGLLKSIQLNPPIMQGIWTNYFRSAYRNLSRNKLHGLLSLTGLVASFIVFMAIGQYYYFERHYDDFHPNSDRLYRLTHRMTDQAGAIDQATTFHAVREYIDDAIPQVERSTQVFTFNGGLLVQDDEMHQVNEVIFTTPDFFELFDFPLIQGNAIDLVERNMIFLSQAYAKKLFPEGNAIGKALQVRDIFFQSWNVQIAGVYKDIPQNSHLKAQIILPITKVEQFARDGQIFTGVSLDQVTWRWMSFPTYVLLQKGADPSWVTKLANEIVEENRSVFNARLNQSHEVWLQPVSDIHTTPDIQSEVKPANDASVLNLLLAVAIGVILIGWINYINMGTARSISRGKEVGIRKVMGSTKNQLKRQFQVESFILSGLGLIIAFGVLVPLHALLENIVDVAFFANRLLSPNIYMILGLIWVVGSWLMGYYPARVLSGYRITDVLKGKLSYSKKGILLRRILVTIQFVFSIILLSGVLLVKDQMAFMLNAPLGINIDQKLLIDGPGSEIGEADYPARMRALKNELLQVPGVEKVSLSSIVPGIQNGWRNSIENTDTEGAGIFAHRSIIDEDYMDVFELELAAGRPLSPDHGLERGNILVNEFLASRLGFVSAEEALNQDIVFTDGSFKIVGVVRDFYQRGVQVAMEPITFNLDTALLGNYITLDVTGNDWGRIRSEANALFQQQFPEAPYRARFLDAVFEEQYQQEKRFLSLLTLFSSIAVIIACLGVLGLASFIMNQRLKEISIRKVLGARVGSLFLILNKEYLVISAVAFAITVPGSYYLISNWLDDYANRVAITLWYFVFPVILILVAVLLTTLWYTIRAIAVNPAVTLKDEG